jgi:hypothetical protein
MARRRRRAGVDDPPQARPVAPIAMAMMAGGLPGGHAWRLRPRDAFA